MELPWNAMEKRWSTCKLYTENGTYRDEQDSNQFPEICSRFTPDSQLSFAAADPREDHGEFRDRDPKSTPCDPLSFGQL